VKNKMLIKKKQQKGKYLPLALFFILGVVCLIIITYLWQLVLLISQSTFDNAHQYTIAVIAEKKVKLISFIPENDTISALTVTGKFDTSLIGKTLEVPYDGKIIGDIKENIRSLLKNRIFSIKKEETGMNSLDIVKLWWYAKSVPPNRIIEATISLPENQNNGENIIQKLFTDKTVYQEAKTIQIINATGIGGYGNRLSKLLTNIGGNVIILAGSNKPFPSTTVTYATELSYTVAKLEKILHVQATQTIQKPVVAEITITIGKDMIGTKIF